MRLGVAYAHDRALRVQQRHQRRRRVVATEDDHVFGPACNGPASTGKAHRPVPAARPRVDLARHAHRDHQLDQRSRVRRDEALRAIAGQRLELQARPIGIGQPGVGAQLRVSAVGKVGNVAHAAGIGGDVGNDAARMLAREQHVGPERRRVLRKGDKREVEAGEMRERCAAAHRVGRGLEVLRAHRLQQGLGKFIVRHTT